MVKSLIFTAENAFTDFVQPTGVTFNSSTGQITAVNASVEVKKTRESTCLEGAELKVCLPYTIILHLAKTRAQYALELPQTPAVPTDIEITNHINSLLGSLITAGAGVLVHDLTKPTKPAMIRVPQFVVPESQVAVISAIMTHELILDSAYVVRAIEFVPVFGSDTNVHAIRIMIGGYPYTSLEALSALVASWTAPTTYELIGTDDSQLALIGWIFKDHEDAEALMATLSTVLEDQILGGHACLEYYKPCLSKCDCLVRYNIVSTAPIPDGHLALKPKAKKQAQLGAVVFNRVVTYVDPDLLHVRSSCANACCFSEVYKDLLTFTDLTTGYTPFILPGTMSGFPYTVQNEIAQAQ